MDNAVQLIKEKINIGQVFSQEKILSLLYEHTLGRVCLRILISPCFSKAGGWLLQTRLSSLAILPFVKSHGIDLSECEKTSFESYNDFFTRKLKASARPLCEDCDAWISPCDSVLSVYPIEQDRRFCIKNTWYTLEELLKDKKLAERYQGGYLWLYRLSVEDYHRYIYPVSGQKSSVRRIAGVFHTVNPIANDVYPIYKENTREYCLIKTEKAGTVLMMEVGAMLVGKIENRSLEAGIALCGEEKGNFAFGGSTIIVLTQNGRVKPLQSLLEATDKGLETKVKLGEKTGLIINYPLSL